MFEEWVPPARRFRIPPDPVNANWAFVFNAFELAVAHTGWPLPPEIVQSSAFTIFHTDPGRSEWFRNAIQCTAPKTQAFIERIQPYEDTDYRKNKLWVMNELDRIGKHRTLPVLAQSLSATDRFLVDGAPIAGYVFARQPNMNVSFNADVALTLGRDEEAPHASGSTIRRCTSDTCLVLSRCKYTRSVVAALS